MSFGTILYNLIIYPLQLFFETLYGVAYRLIGNYGLAIIALSLAVNIIVFPLYRRADAMQKEERDIQEKMSRWVKHIRQTFKGDERYMMLQAYYRENHYSSFMVLRGSVSLLLQIPFFTAAYRFLHNYQAIRGVSFGPIADLGAPDGLLQIAGLSINLLPILMTLINIVSGAIYTRGMPIKSKIQLYGMALIFLVLLYRSPAGLVFYWTLNNLFSLVKNILYKIPRLGDVLRGDPHAPRTATKEQRTGFLLGGITLALLVGLLIPSALVADSPLEFVSTLNPANPNLYVLNALLIATGLFVVWFGVFYWLSGASGKRGLAFVVWAGAILCIVNYMAFGRNTGTINADLVYEEIPSFARREQLINLLVLAALLVVAYLVWKKARKLTGVVILALLVGVAGMSVKNIVSTQRVYAEYTARADEEADLLQIPLSKTEKNVVVIMLDRAIDGYIPYIMNERPEVAAQFAGFTWYPNTISYGMTTNFASAALFGGYEYTPEEINRRDTETLEQKQDEALKVMPKLFSDAGCDVTVSDPPYAGYSWVPDLTIFDDIPNVRAYNAQGTFTDSIPVARENTAYKRHRNFFCYGIMKAAPLVLRNPLYENGNYYGNHSAVVTSFCDAFSVLTSLPDITEVRDQAQGTFFMIANDATHEPCYLQKPDYVPAVTIDNEVYDAEVADRLVVDGKPLQIDTEYKFTHYNVNVASMIALGKWFDFLREQGVYDNTRIILVADHGRSVSPTGEEVFEGKNNGKKLDTTLFRPLLMMKDFGAKEMTTDETFMTNADVPTLALAGVVDKPVNPYTGKAITNTDKLDVSKRHVVVSGNWDLQDGSDTKLDSTGGQWYEVGDDLLREDNWKEIDEL